MKMVEASQKKNDLKNVQKKRPSKQPVDKENATLNWPPRMNLKGVTLKGGMKDFGK